MSRHPELNSYITDVLEGALPLLRKGHVDKFVVVLEKAKKAIERYVFEVGSNPKQLLPLCAFDYLSSYFQVRIHISDQLDDAAYAQLAECFRAMLMKLETVDAQLGPCVKDTTFNLVLHVVEFDSSAENQMWLCQGITDSDPAAKAAPAPSYPSQQRTESLTGIVIEQPLVVPLKTMVTPSIGMQLFCEAPSPASHSLI